MNDKNLENDFIAQGGSIQNNKPEFEDSGEVFSIVLLDYQQKIIHADQFFLRQFPSSEVNSILNIKSDPNLSTFLHSFIESPLPEVKIDFTFFRDEKNSIEDFVVNAKKINLYSKEYLLLILNSAEIQNKLESKVNSLHRAVEHGNLPLMIIDHTGKISYLTKSLENILRRTIEDFYGMFFTEALNLLFPITDLQAAESAFKHKEEWIKVIPAFDDFNNITFREYRLRPIRSVDESNIQFLLTASDVTQYVLRNEAVKESERKLKSIINNISDILFIIREEKTEFYFELVNKQFLESFHAEQDDVLNKNIKSILKENFIRKLLDSIDELKLSSIQVVEISVECNTAFYKGFISTPETQIASNSLYIINLKDVSSQYKYEEQLKSAYQKEIHLNKLKSAFIKNISHEIRTPLTAIAGYSEIIQDYIAEKDYESINELLFSIKDVMYRIVNLFSNIVELSQIEAGEYQSNLVILNCNQVLKSVRTKFEADAKKKNLQIILNISKNELLIEVDWIILEKIIAALVSNAIKYTSEGDILITSYSSNSRAYISITDKGVGISKDILPFLLEPFAQEEIGYTKKYEGAGLGLSIAYKLTKLLKGTFEIISEKNSGTNILISFPEKSQQDLLINT